MSAPMSVKERIAMMKAKKDSEEAEKPKPVTTPGGGKSIAEKIAALKSKSAASPDATGKMPDQISHSPAPAAATGEGHFTSSASVVMKSSKTATESSDSNENCSGDGSARRMSIKERMAALSTAAPATPETAAPAAHASSNSTTDAASASPNSGNEPTASPVKRGSIADRIAAMKASAAADAEKQEKERAAAGAAVSAGSKPAGSSNIKRLSMGMNIPMGAFNPMAPRPPGKMFATKTSADDSDLTSTAIAEESEVITRKSFAADDDDRSLKHASLSRAAIPNSRRKRVTSAPRLSREEILRMQSDAALLTPASVSTPASTASSSAVQTISEEGLATVSTTTDSAAPSPQEDNGTSASGSS